MRWSRTLWCARSKADRHPILCSGAYNLTQFNPTHRRFPPIGLEVKSVLCRGGSVIPSCEGQDHKLPSHSNCTASRCDEPRGLCLLSPLHKNDLYRLLTLNQGGNSSLVVGVGRTGARISLWIDRTSTSCAGESQLAYKCLNVRERRGEAIRDEGFVGCLHEGRFQVGASRVPPVWASVVDKFPAPSATTPHHFHSHSPTYFVSCVFIFVLSFGFMSLSCEQQPLFLHSPQTLDTLVMRIHSAPSTFNLPPSHL